jgi:hypothetical protein
MYQRESIAYAEPTEPAFFLTMAAMETRNQVPSIPVDLLSPLAGWEAAARWNRATFDWMAKGWQQWLALLTTVPPHWVETLAPLPGAPHSVTPAQAGAQDARPARAPDTLGSRLRGNDGARAAARAEPKRPARAKPAAQTKSKKARKARTRG